MKLQASPSFEPLAVVTRGGLVESVHHGLVVIAPYDQGFENAAYISGDYINEPSTDWNESASAN